MLVCIVHAMIWCDGKVLDVLRYSICDLRSSYSGCRARSLGHLRADEH